MRPLEGLKVLDFCWVAAGPMTTGYLVEYGATVVRIESHVHPDTLHNSPPLVARGVDRIVVAIMPTITPANTLLASTWPIRKPSTLSSASCSGPIW